MSLGGASTDLILDPGASPAGRVYRAANDNGWRFFRTTAGGANNPDKNNEAWRVEVPDGRVLWFGRSTILAADGSSRATDSVATVPVYEDAGEPDGAGWHTLGYRWMLDQEYDIRENAVNYFYTRETNRYRRHDGVSVEYTSAVYPESVEYGEQVGSLTARPPARVVFSLVGRCLDRNVLDPWSDIETCPSLADSPGQFPDVPSGLSPGLRIPAYLTCSAFRSDWVGC